MKVLFILNSFYRESIGGAEYQAWLLARRLISRSHRVHYLHLSVRDYQDTVDDIVVQGIKRKTAQHWLGEFIYSERVRNCLQEMKPDILYHRNLTPLFLPALAYCRKQGVSGLVHLAHTKDLRPVSVELNFIKNNLRRCGNRKILKQVRRIIAQSNDQGRLLYRYFQRRPDLVVSNAHPLPEAEIRKNPQRQVIWVANWKKMKQPGIFLQLARRCRDLPVTFLMVGSQSQKRWVRQVLARNPVSPRLRILSEQSLEQVNNHLTGAHILVNTSRYEGFPNTFIQAWMRKVPVVSLSVDPDRVLQKNGIGFRSGSFEKLVADTRQLIRDDRLRKDMGERARIYAHEHYSLKNFDQIIRLMEQDHAGK
jgi:glycosyltransferase involved in cell wall biosynthesis